MKRKICFILNIFFSSSHFRIPEPRFLFQIFDRWKLKHYPNSLGTSSYRRLPNISQYSLLAFYAILLNRSLHFFDQFLSQTSSHPFPVIIPDILKYEVLAVGPYISQCYSSFHSRNILIFQIWRSIIPRLPLISPKKRSYSLI